MLCIRVIYISQLLENQMNITVLRNNTISNILRINCEKKKEY